MFYIILSPNRAIFGLKIQKIRLVNSAQYQKHLNMNSRGALNILTKMVFNENVIILTPRYERDLYIKCIKQDFENQASASSRR